MTEDTDIDTFMKWFQSNGGSVDLQVMGISEFPGSGRGAIALRDIPEGHTIFTLPRSLTLSTRTSPLPGLFGLEAWRKHGLHKGWVGLILCMMWEDAWAHKSISDAAEGLDSEHDNSYTPDIARTKWGPYLRMLPMTFDTPMFWSTEELDELRGTAVIDKIGRRDAELAYVEQLVPAIQTSPVLFPPSHHEKWYSLDAYHRAGSRILSRSFSVSRWTGGDAEEDEEAKEEGNDVVESESPNSKIFIESVNQADDSDPRFPLLEDINDGNESDSEDDDDPSDVAMVPMADFLNARWGSENAKLFYEPVILRMVTTKNIKQGEQIFNTYGDPPNSELLRRYGHVDLVQLHPSSSVPTLDVHGDVEMKYADAGAIKYLENPSDVAEIRADLVVHVVQTSSFNGSKAKDSHTRIEWWLEEGEDDVFVLSLPEPGSQPSEVLPPELISFIRLLVLSEPDFKSARSKGKLPRGKLRRTDAQDNKAVLEILDEVLKQRECMYAGGSIEDDESLLSNDKTIADRKRHAVIVRLGEKRILRSIRQAVTMMLVEFSSLCGAVYRSEDGGTRRGGNCVNGEKEAGSAGKRVVSGTEGGHGRKKVRR